MSTNPIPARTSKNGKKLHVRAIGKIGAPTTQILHLIQTLAKDCTPTRYIAARLGYGESTFYDHMKKYPEIKKAIQLGRSKRFEAVIGVHTDIMSDPTVNPTTRLAAAHFELNNVHKLSESASAQDNSINVVLNVSTDRGVKTLSTDTCKIIDVAPMDSDDD